MVNCTPFRFILARVVSLVFHSPFFHVHAMSKRANSTQNEPQAKRSRIRTGFRLARPVPSDSPPCSSSSSSLFVTVHRRGNLTADNRLLPSTLEPSAPSASSVPQPPSDPQATDTNDQEVPSGSQVEVEQMPPPDTEAGSKPKRKRYTKNVVSY